MIRLSVISSELRSVGYEEKTLTLEVQFHRRGTYQYFGVAKDTYLNLMSASSKGRYFNAAIKDTHSYQRIT